jgi:hypothetical protein
MPTAITKTVGDTGGAGRDTANLNTFAGLLPASIVATDETWTADLYNDAELTTAAAVITTTADATRFVTIKAATGQGFKDNAGIRSSALFYNASNGIGIRFSATYSQLLQIQARNTQIKYLQFKNTSTSDNSYAIRIDASMPDCIVDSCILEGEAAGALVGDASAIFRNCLIVSRKASRHAIADQGAHLYNCTLVSTSGGADAIKGNYLTGLIIKNTAIFNFSSIYDGSGGFALSTSSDYNSTDLSAPTNWGSHSLASQTFANQFESTTTDFRAKAGANLINAGTPDSTNAPNDITGTARSASTPTIGAWEVTGGGGGGTTGLRDGLVNGGILLNGRLM